MGKVGSVFFSESGRLVQGRKKTIGNTSRSGLPEGRVGQDGSARYSAAFITP